MIQKPVRNNRPCGSIIRGHRREFETMMPFSVLNASTGSPAICQALILIGSPKVVVREKLSEQGISLFIQRSCQSNIAF